MEYRIHPRTGDRIGVIGIGSGPLCDASGEGRRCRAHLCPRARRQPSSILPPPARGRFRTPARRSRPCAASCSTRFTSAPTTKRAPMAGQPTSTPSSGRSSGSSGPCARTTSTSSSSTASTQRATGRRIATNGVLDYLLEMKKAGVVRHVGLSSHTPELAQAVLDVGVVEQLMFSINPAYDYQHGEYANGSAGERMRCTAAAKRRASAYRS